MCGGDRGKPANHKELMPPVGATKAERRMQPRFRINLPALFVLLLALAGMLFIAPAQIFGRRPLPRPVALLRSKPIKLDPADFRPLRLAGAWRLESNDRNFGGISALALEGGQFVAVSDGLVALRFAPPGGSATSIVRLWRPTVRKLVSDLVPFDMEAMARVPGGWWVAIERVHELTRFDSALERPQKRIWLSRSSWATNHGVEGMIAGPDGILLFPENGSEVVELRGRKRRSLPIEPEAGPVSDAARLPDGRILLLVRKATPLGFRSSLVELRRSAKGYRPGAVFRLGLGLLDNPEGLAVEPLPGGGTRLWIITDDNFRWPMRTLLVALDWPKGA